MAYSLDFAISTGIAGQTLEAQLVDTAGANVGAAITTGFVDHGRGLYQWHTSAIPDDHRGAAVFQLSPGGLVQAIASVNPEENESQWSELLSATLRAREIMKVLEAASGGKVSGADGPIVRIRNAADTKNVITASVDAFGNRNTVTLDLS